MNCSLPTKHQPITATVRRWTCSLKTPKFCRWKLDTTFYFHAHVSCLSLCHEEIHHHLRIIEQFGQKWVWNWLIPFALVRTWWGWLAATAADRTVPLSAPLSGSDLGRGRELGPQQRRTRRVNRNIQWQPMSRCPDESDAVMWGLLILCCWCGVI